MLRKRQARRIKSQQRFETREQRAHAKWVMTDRDAERRRKKLAKCPNHEVAVPHTVDINFAESDKTQEYPLFTTAVTAGGHIIGYSLHCSFCKDQWSFSAHDQLLHP